VTLHAIQTTVERREAHFATAAAMTRASVLTAGALRANLATLASITRQKDRRPLELAKQLNP
jgi:hypothetical protein